MEYREAIEYDLLTQTGYELKDVGRTLSWDALDSFLSHADPGTALMQKLNPEVSAWSETLKTNAILADIFDMLAIINANLMAIGSGKRAKRPKPYSRPVQHDPENEQHWGRDALPVEELHAWIEDKRTEHAGSSKGHDNRHTGS